MECKRLMNISCSATWRPFLGLERFQIQSVVRCVLRNDLRPVLLFSVDEQIRATILEFHIYQLFLNNCKFIIPIAVLVKSF